jgi:hypothetical protein
MQYFSSYFTPLGELDTAQLKRSNKLLKSNHFYYPTNALNYTNLEVKIYVV